MNFNENDLWRDKTDLLNLRLSKLLIAKAELEIVAAPRHGVPSRFGDQQ